MLSEHDSIDSITGWEARRGPGDLFDVRCGGSGLDGKGQSRSPGRTRSRTACKDEGEGEGGRDGWVSGLVGDGVDGGATRRDRNP